MSRLPRFAIVRHDIPLGERSRTGVTFNADHARKAGEAGFIDHRWVDGYYTLVFADDRRHVFSLHWISLVAVDEEDTRVPVATRRHFLGALVADDPAVGDLVRVKCLYTAEQRAAAAAAVNGVTPPLWSGDMVGAMEKTAVITEAPRTGNYMLRYLSSSGEALERLFHRGWFQRINNPHVEVHRDTAAALGFPFATVPTDALPADKRKRVEALIADEERDSQQRVERLRALLE